LLLTALLAAALLQSGNLQAQESTHGSDNESWGTYSWQVDQASSTITLIGQATFKSPPGLVQIPVAIRHATTIRHVHGSVSLWVPETGVNGSIMAMLRDQNGNALVAVKMQQFGDATVTLPIDATLSSDCPITSLELSYYVDMPGTQVVYMSFAVN
jgi:hypothetical protein